MTLQALAQLRWWRVGTIVPMFAVLLLFDGLSGVEEDRCIPQVSYETYDVGGVTMDEWRASMLRSGPKDYSGKQRFARADWYVSWNWQLDSSEMIVPDSVKVECSAHIVLPRLVPSEGLSISASRRWWRFVEEVRKHELNHLRHAVELSPRIKERIGRHDRSLKAEEGNAVAFGVLREMRSLDLLYDKRTNHGFSEGIWGNHPDLHEVL